MATESSGFDEAMDVGTSTISHLKALKTASTITKAGFGAAGGPFTAAIGIAIANRHGIAKIIIVIIAILLLPVLFILMLPGLIFGSLMEDTGALNSNTIINDNIRASREAIVEVLEESHADILSEINAAIAKLPEGDTASINDSYTYNISVNANLLISQFCASQDNYENINLRKLKSLIRKNKDGLFSYDVATETVTMEVVVEGGAEGENSPEGNENAEPQTKTVTFTRHTYTVQYAGDAYFADHVFHLTDEQKKLAQDYAENLTTFFGNAASGVAMAINLSDEVLSYRPAVERIAAKYGMSEYVELILAVMMQESGGRGLDVMQAAEGSFNTKYPHKPNGITDPEYSIECGIQELKYALEKAGCTGPTDLDRIKLALQGYPFCFPFNGEHAVSSIFYFLPNIRICNLESNPPANRECTFRDSHCRHLLFRKYNTLDQIRNPTSFVHLSAFPVEINELVSGAFKFIRLYDVALPVFQRFSILSNSNTGPAECLHFFIICLLYLELSFCYLRLVVRFVPYFHYFIECFHFSPSHTSPHIYSAGVMVE